MLVVDVAAETPRSYRIPYSFDDYHEAWHHLRGGFCLLADGFDLNGQMCLVVNVGFYPVSRKKTQFWVMKPPCELEGKGQEDDKLYWDLRYIFCFDDPFTLTMPRGAWIDHAQTLCYRFGNFVYKYDTRGYSSPSNVDSLLFDERLDLPDAPRYPS
ncbi:unnamed protein product [Miscanthus lutarioriparius]|uniref:DUF295 domain-containing protein n=1 Tax=Miscanthus lutarioriparius TaxID=422564 RepID=A0A811QSI4_9POAL|nr:unnamed protein product [Miscanthus lutarioriparius]